MPSGSGRRRASSRIIDADALRAVFFARADVESRRHAGQGVDAPLLEEMAFKFCRYRQDISPASRRHRPTRG